MSNRSIYKPEKFAQASRLFREGKSLRQVMAIVGLSNATAGKYRRIVFEEHPEPLCACGQLTRHQGWCSYRISRSNARQQYLTKCAAQSARTQHVRQQEHDLRQAEREDRRQLKELEIRSRPRRQIKRRVAVEPATAMYPYFHKGGEDHDLVLRVNEIVPKTLPYQIRADICQEILLAILNGELLEHEATASLKIYTSRIINQQQDRWKEIPIDAPVHFQDGDAHTLADCMSAEDYADRLKNAWEANRLLTPRQKTYGTTISASHGEDNTSATRTMQVVGLGRRKMGSKIHHAGHKFAKRNYSHQSRDQIMFFVRDYQEKRAEQDKAEVA